jgi:hypothetical protein
MRDTLRKPNANCHPDADTLKLHKHFGTFFSPPAHHALSVVDHLERIRTVTGSL